MARESTVSTELKAARAKVAELINERNTVMEPVLEVKKEIANSRTAIRFLNDKIAAFEKEHATKLESIEKQLRKARFEQKLLEVEEEKVAQKELFGEDE